MSEQNNTAAVKFVLPDEHEQHEGWGFGGVVKRRIQEWKEDPHSHYGGSVQMEVEREYVILTRTTDQVVIDALADRDDANARAHDSYMWANSVQQEWWDAQKPWDSLKRVYAKTQDQLAQATEQLKTKQAQHVEQVKELQDVIEAQKNINKETAWQLTQANAKLTKLREQLGALRFDELLGVKS